MDVDFLTLVVSRIHTHTHTHPFNGPFPGLPGWADTRKVKPIWILLKQETVSGSGISWAICKSAPYSRQTTMPASHRSVFTGRMPFLPPNQQCQSTEGKRICLENMFEDNCCGFLRARCCSCQQTQNVAAVKDIQSTELVQGNPFPSWSFQFSNSEVPSGLCVTRELSVSCVLSSSCELCCNRCG